MSTSILYDTIKASAGEFLHSMEVKPSTFSFDKTRVLAARTSDFQQSWGHNFFTSSKPAYRRSLDIDHLIVHLEEMAPQYEFVRAEITDAYVDEPRKTAIVRSSLFLQVKGVSETVENDIVWFLEMNESGEKVKKATEFMDSMAGGRLQELFKGAKK